MPQNAKPSIKKILIIFILLIATVATIWIFQHLMTQNTPGTIQTQHADGQNTVAQTKDSPAANPTLNSVTTCLGITHARPDKENLLSHLFGAQSIPAPERAWEVWHFRAQDGQVFILKEEPSAEAGEQYGISIFKESVDGLPELIEKNQIQATMTNQQLKESFSTEHTLLYRERVVRFENERAMVVLVENDQGIAQLTLDQKNKHIECHATNDGLACLCP